MIPSRIDELRGGVMRDPFFTIKIFSPAPSLTNPSESRQMPSSYPFSFASIATNVPDK